MNVPALQAVTLGTALHLVARADVDALLAALADTRSRHRGVHNARKAIRRLRSVLLLGRKAFGKAGRQLDIELKALGLGLSALRDAHVAVDTAAARARTARTDAARTRWQAARKALATRRTAVLRDALRDDPQFEARRAAVNLHAGSIDALPWHLLDNDNVQRELARSVRRMHAAGRKADAPDASLEARHRWRRRMRRLRMQWKALKDLRQQAASAEVDAQATELLHALREHAPQFRRLQASADALGAEQDRGLLDRALAEVPRAAPIAAARRELRANR